MGAVVERTVRGPQARRLDRVLKPFASATDYVAAHYDELLAQHAERWIAVAGGGLVAASKTRAGLRRQLRQTGQDPAKLHVTFLTRERRTLIL
jgi:hypothetical protein